MRESNYLNRIFAIVALIATLFVILFSTSFLSEHVTHHCQDDSHCPVCSMIVQCENSIRTLGSSLVVAAVVAFIFQEVAKLVGTFDFQSVQTTLVSQKVRLDS